MHIVYKGDRVMNTLQDLIKKYASQYKEQVVDGADILIAIQSYLVKKKIHLYLFKRLSLIHI